MNAVEKMFWKPIWTIDKFTDPTGLVGILSQHGFPIEKLKQRFPSQYRGRDVYEGNCLLNTGINSIAWPLIIGSGGTALGASAYIGVGDNATASGDATKTGLLGTTTFVVMDGGYPTEPTTQAVSWRSTFTAALANRAWSEICVTNTNTNASGTVLNRLVQVMGTKASPAVWIVTLTITLA